MAYLMVLKIFYQLRVTKQRGRLNTHKEQIINETATIVKKLENNGAVLIAKLSMGP